MISALRQAWYEKRFRDGDPRYFSAPAEYTIIFNRKLNANRIAFFLDRYPEDILEGFSVLNSINTLTTMAIACVKAGRLDLADKAMAHLVEFENYDKVKAYRYFELPLIHAIEDGKTDWVIEHMRTIGLERLRLLGRVDIIRQALHMKELDVVDCIFEQYNRGGAFINPCVIPDLLRYGKVDHARKIFDRQSIPLQDLRAIPLDQINEDFAADVKERIAQIEEEEKLATLRENFASAMDTLRKKGFDDIAEYAEDAARFAEGQRMLEPETP